MSSLLSQPMLGLFAILAIGPWIGQLSSRGLSLEAAEALRRVL